MKLIKSINITGSSFFEDIEIKYSPQLNCIMGGRGTGKTTLMNFIWAALDDKIEDDRNIYNLLKNNLENGQITLIVEGEEGIEYKIVKTLNDDPQVYELPSEEPIPFHKIKNKLSVEIYPALKIESIGRSPYDRLKLIDKKVGEELPHLINKLKSLRFELDSNASDILSSINKISSLDELIRHYENIEDEFKQHKEKKTTNITHKEKELFEAADKNEKIRKDEKRLFNKWFEFNTTFKSSLIKYKTYVEDYRNNNNIAPEEYSNKDIIKKSKVIIDKAITNYIDSIDSLIKNSEQPELNNLFNELSDKHDLQQAEFIKLKQKFEADREYISRYNDLSKKINEKKNLISDSKELKSKSKSFYDTRNSLLEEFKKTKSKIYSLRLNCIKDLNSLFKEEIKITLKHGGNTDNFEEVLRSSLKGSGLRYNELIPRIVENFDPIEFAKIIQEKDETSLKEIGGIDTVRSKAIIEVLFNTPNIYEIESLYCEDYPDFNLKVQGIEGSKINYKKTEELSLGQRCTTILPVIFSVSKNPLLIDQPEDNLDNRFITNKIHSIVREQKSQRQLIFITHNPNIPVLSDSEYNIFLKYNYKSSILKEGNIDEVKSEILDLLEGGKEAFDRRTEIYNANQSSL